MPKILITGALGMIGRALSETLLQKDGYAVDGIDIKVFPDSMTGSKLHFYRIDIRDNATITDLIINGNYDCIVHLAAISRVVDGEKDKPNCIQTNYVGTRNIIDAVAKYSPTTHVIFASSREVYGEQKSLPVSEDAELLPINVYGFYKLLAEQYIRATISNYTILRLCNVYGSAYDLPGRVIPNFVRRAITGETMTIEGGSQMIDFTYIKDTVWAFCQCIELIPAGLVNKETITISPGEGHTLQEIVEILSSELGRNLNVRITPERNYDVQRFVGNRAHREKLLGDRRFLSLPEGIRQTLTLYKNLYRNDELKG